jgi:hypothetical protein
VTADTNKPTISADFTLATATYIKDKVCPNEWCILLTGTIVPSGTAGGKLALYKLNYTYNETSGGFSAFKVIQANVGTTLGGDEFGSLLNAYVGV